ncbi:MAG TPA: hypothetical protein DEB25_01895 [Desulfobulbaceae bacterium]|nr:hypothetical protein [Desulfobulbaceae bacterium]
MGDGQPVWPCRHYAVGGFFFQGDFRHRRWPEPHHDFVHDFSQDFRDCICIPTAFTGTVKRS